MYALTQTQLRHFFLVGADCTMQQYEVGPYQHIHPFSCLRIYPHLSEGMLALAKDQHRTDVSILYL